MTSFYRHLAVFPPLPQIVWRLLPRTDMLEVPIRQCPLPVAVTSPSTVTSLPLEVSTATQEAIVYNGDAAVHQNLAGDGIAAAGGDAAGPNVT